jgi:hypothetical protein
MISSNRVTRPAAVAAFCIICVSSFLGAQTQDIQVVSASYGSVSCHTPVGNVTGIVAAECDGEVSCNVYVDNSVFGDPAYGCAKDFTAQWTCGTGTALQTASHGPVVGEGYTVLLSCVPLTITPTSVPSVASGQAYRATLAASGGSGSGYTWSLPSGSLPAGFTLSPAGVLSSTGSPLAVANSYSFTVQVTDSAGDTATQPLTLLIQCPVNVTWSVGGLGGTSMNATFIPVSGLTLPAAAQACGFAGFDWQQTITSLPCPSPYFANSPSGLGACSQNGSLAAPPAFNDPPIGGYTYQPGYNPAPFCYPSASALSNEQSPGAYCVSTLASGSCLVPLVSANDETLAFYDAPADPCLPSGNPGLQSTYCGGLTDPPSSSIGFTTALVGINQDSTASLPLYQWTWTDNFNGTSGGIPTTSNPLPVDPGSGTGGITVTSVNGVLGRMVR